MSLDIMIASDGNVATIEMRRPPLNYFDLAFISAIADALDSIDSDTNIRAVVLAAQGKAFCAGADFNALPLETKAEGRPLDGGHLYMEAARIFQNKKPIIAACMVQQSVADSAWRCRRIFE